MTGLMILMQPRPKSRRWLGHTVWHADRVHERGIPQLSGQVRCTGRLAVLCHFFIVFKVATQVHRSKRSKRRGSAPWGARFARVLQGSCRDKGGKLLQHFLTCSFPLLSWMSLWSSKDIHKCYRSWKQRCECPVFASFSKVHSKALLSMQALARFTTECAVPYHTKKKRF